MGALAGGGFAFSTAFVLWKLLKVLPGGVRVSREHEIEGLDLAECGVEAYADELRGASLEALGGAAEVSSRDYALQKRAAAET